MPAVFHHRLVVGPDDIDAFGHANNMRILGWTLDAAIAHATAQGWPTERFMEELGASFLVRSHKIRYLRPALLGEAVVIETWVADFRRVASLRKYRIVREADGKLLARAETDWAFVNLSDGSPRPVDEVVHTSFELVDR